MDLLDYLEENGKDDTWHNIGDKFGMTGEAARQKWKRHKKKSKKPNLKLKSQWQVQTKEGVQWLESYTAEDDNEIDIEKIIDLISKKVTEPELNLTDKPLRDLMCVVNLYDLHLDKICLRGTADPKHSFEENKRQFIEVTDEIISELWGIQPKQICLPLGNDLYHINSFKPETKKGTVLDYYLDPNESYAEVTSLVIDFIHKLSQVAPLYIPMIKGNHDEDKVFILGYWLEQMFKQVHTVKIDFTVDQRKYYKFGDNLLGFAHGDKEKKKINELPLIMAQEVPRLWGETRHRKIFCGDLHHTQTFKFLAVKDYPGVEVSYLRGLSRKDRWHHDHGWVGVPRTGYIHTFHEKKGEVRVDKFTI